MHLILACPIQFLLVDPISPHRMLENTTWVSGCWDWMLDGLPWPLVQGPLFPESSHAICWAASFQMLMARTTAERIRGQH